MNRRGLTVDDFAAAPRPEAPLIVGPATVPVFAFGQRCHAGAGLAVEYAAGSLAILCASCRVVICKVAVADV
jgi:hypothetical protein